MKLAVLLLIILISCKSPKRGYNNTTMQDEFYKDSILRKVDTPLIETDRFDSLMKKSHDSIAKEEALKPLTKYELATFEKIRNIHSGAQFLRKYFAIGSTSGQMTKVQGFPDDKVEMGNYTDVWFYGNCEVTVYNGRVTKVENREDCLNYIDVKICLLSADDIVGDNMHRVIVETKGLNQ